MSWLVPQGPGIPLPRPSAVSQPFWDGCAIGELRVQRCATCATALFDPTLRCRSCGGSDLRWEVSSGHGTVSTWATVWRPQTPEFTVPYTAAIIRLDEGCDMVSNLIGCSVDDVATGMAVRVEFHPIRDGIVLPYFTPQA